MNIIVIIAGLGLAAFGAGMKPKKDVDGGAKIVPNSNAEIEPATQSVIDVQSETLKGTDINESEDDNNDNRA